MTAPPGEAPSQATAPAGPLPVALTVLGHPTTGKADALEFKCATTGCDYRRHSNNLMRHCCTKCPAGEHGHRCEAIKVQGTPDEAWVDRGKVPAADTWTAGKWQGQPEEGGWTASPSQKRQGEHAEAAWNQQAWGAWNASPWAPAEKRARTEDRREMEHSPQKKAEKGQKGKGGKRTGSEQAKGGPGAERANRVACSVHGNKRPPYHLVDDGAGGMCCPPGDVCRGFLGPKGKSKAPKGGNHQEPAQAAWPAAKGPASAGKPSGSSNDRWHAEEWPAHEVDPVLPCALPEGTAPEDRRCPQTPATQAPGSPEPEDQALEDEEDPSPEAEEEAEQGTMAPGSLLQTKPKGNPTERPATISASPQVCLPVHPDLTGPAWRLMILNEGCTVSHRTGALTAEELLSFTSRLQSSVAWEKQNHKKEAFYTPDGCGCWFGGAQGGVEGQPFPPWMKEAMYSVMSVCDVADSTDHPTACHLQQFRGRDQMQDWYNMGYDIFGGSHMKGRTITLSMGVTRKFLIRHPWNSKNEDNILAHQMHEGDILVMDGTFHQKYYVKIPPFDELGKGSHYLITWAWITDHASYCDLATSDGWEEAG